MVIVTIIYTPPRDGWMTKRFYKSLLKIFYYFFSIGYWSLCLFVPSPVHCLTLSKMLCRFHFLFVL